jgi:hypothetical protein
MTNLNTLTIERKRKPKERPLSLSGSKPQVTQLDGKPQTIVGPSLPT